MREWNVAFNVFDDIDTIVPTVGTMDTTALDPMGGSYNNYLDWDDSYNGGAGVLNNCSAGVPVGAGYPFPEDKL